jgi:holo-[acyl-carrier protein] synthase
MRIIGIGLDATDIPRVRKTVERFGDRFLNRIFTAGELAYCMRKRDPAESLAARFAAKEAAMKALGTGHTQQVLWKDIEVVRGFGAPQLRFHGGAARRFQALGSNASLVTITHSDSVAIAQVVIMHNE